MTHPGESVSGGATKGTLDVALLQTSPRLGDVEGNLADLHEQVRQVAGVDVAVTPELALQGYTLREVPRVSALTADDARLRELAGHGPAVAVGFVEAWRHRRFNSCALLDGPELHVQRKLFLPTYDIWEERKHFQPGSGLSVVDLRGARVAVLICNDLWQPVLPWMAAHAGAEVLIVTANSAHASLGVPVARTWDLLLTHAAVTLQSYVVFVNRVGTEAETRFWGGSRVVGPDGNLLAQLGEDADRVTARLDLTGLRALRARWPLLGESRFDLVAREAQRFARELP